MPSVAIGIDLGGTRIKGVVLDEEGNILHQVYTPTYDSTEQVWKQAIPQTIQLLLEKIKTSQTCVGLAAPGIPNDENTCIAYMPGRLEGLQGLMWHEHLKFPAWVVNDAVSAMMAEAKFGAASGKKNIVMLTLGTGVGGAILIDGKPYQGSFQKAGHFGHTTIDCEGEQDITGMPGSLEDAIGNCTIYKRSAGKYRFTHQLLEDVRKGDEDARAIWLVSVKKLAIGIASITNTLSPELIVIGGGITEAGDELFVPLEKYLDLYEWRVGGKVKIVKAHFGDLAGAIGAATFAQMKSNQDY